MAGQGDHHVDLQRKSRCARVEARGHGAHDAGVLEPADAVQRRGRGQPDDPRELEVRAVGVGLQLGEDLHVNIVKGNAHSAKLYSVDEAFGDHYLASPGDLTV